MAIFLSVYESLLSIQIIPDASYMLEYLKNTYRFSYSGNMIEKSQEITSNHWSLHSFYDCEFRNRSWYTRVAWRQEFYTYCAILYKLLSWLSFDLGISIRTFYSSWLKEYLVSHLPRSLKFRKTTAPCEHLLASAIIRPTGILIVMLQLLGPDSSTYTPVNSGEFIR